MTQNSSDSPEKPWLPPTNSHDDEPTILIHCNIVNVDHALILKDHAITYSNGIITSVVPTSKADLRKGKIVNVNNRYVCPGLIDCHVHLFYAFTTPTKHSALTDDETTKTLRASFLGKQMLLRGFTTCRDTGGCPKSLANAFAEWLAVGPRLYCSVKSISQTGGHGDARFASEDQHGRGPSVCCHGTTSTARVVDGVPACLEATRDELRRGADFIKICGTGGGVSSVTDPLEGVQFTKEEVRAITTVASNFGTYATAHAYTDESVLHAVLNGCKGVEHGNLIGEKTAQIMAQNGVFLTPTLVTYQALAQPPFDKFIPPASQEKNVRVLEKGLEALQIAQDNGVSICFGTDLIGSMHAVQCQEFAIRKRVLSSPSILASATTTAARMLGAEGKLGVIKEGAFADILILESNVECPLSNVEIFCQPEKNISVVIKDGVPVRSSLQGLDPPSWLKNVTY